MNNFYEKTIYNPENSSAATLPQDSFTPSNLWLDGHTRLWVTGFRFLAFRLPLFPRAIGCRVNDRQGLEWPWWKRPDPDGGPALIPIRLLPRGMGYVDFNIVPRSVIDATCEVARELLISDRTSAPVGKGIDVTQVRHSEAHADGTTKLTSSSTDMTRKNYSKKDTRPIISHAAQAMLVKYGALVQGSGAVRLVRA